MTPTLIVHGGAGTWQLDSERLHMGIRACKEATKAGQKILLDEGTALDAVETATRILEDCPALDAGIGSYLNVQGAVEMDALIMDGQTLSLGAVGSVQRVQHPISLARRVMTDTPHQFLVGIGAEAFADVIGFPRCDPTQLITSYTQNLYEDIRPPKGALGDTVGAVAIDHAGNIAIATSTGGTKHKMAGRIGDSPLVGSGGYADNETAGVSATGHGESIMKVVLSKQVCDFVRMGLTAQAACTAGIALLEKRVQGEGGLIAIDHAGNIGFAFNTIAMPYAYVRGASDIIAGS